MPRVVLGPALCKVGVEIWDGKTSAYAVPHIFGWVGEVYGAGGFGGGVRLFGWRIRVFGALLGGAAGQDCCNKQNTQS
jgi:hypothetical protein